MALLLAVSALAVEVPSSITVDSNKPLNYAGDWCTTPEWMPNTCCAEGQQSPLVGGIQPVPRLASSGYLP